MHKGQPVSHPSNKKLQDIVSLHAKFSDPAQDLRSVPGDMQRTRTYKRRVTAFVRQISLAKLGAELVDKADLTLHTDGTTKFGTKYLGSQIASADRFISPAKSRSAQHTFDGLIQMLEDIDRTIKHGGLGTAVSSKIVSACHTMQYI